MSLQKILAFLFFMFGNNTAPPAPEPEPEVFRTFDMGFTGFVYDNTLEAITNTRQFTKNNGDIICHHIDSVPWSSLAATGELPDAFVDSMLSKMEGTPEGGKVYLALSPGRYGLQAHSSDPEIPAVIEGLSYDDPVVQMLYLQYVIRMIELFDPDYLNIGIEANDTYEYDKYVELHEYVYMALRPYTDIPIFASLTLHNMLNKGAAEIGKIDLLLPYCDLISVSYYPFFVDNQDERLTALDWMVEYYSPYGKPFCVAETNDAAEMTAFGEFTLNGTEEQQLEYYEKLLDVAQSYEFAFVISFVHQDYDGLWEDIADTAPWYFKAWMDCGLIDENGTERPALTVWSEYFESTGD